jgi:DNA-directed RNA polymerase subunit M
MYPDGNEVFCKVCKYRTARVRDATSIIKAEARAKQDKVLEDNEEIMPKTDAVCPDCGHHEAYWHIRQIRAADEAPTRIYRCVKCKHTWRESE